MFNKIRHLLKSIFKSKYINTKSVDYDNWSKNWYKKYSSDKLNLQEEVEESIEVLQSLKAFKDEFSTCGIAEEELYKIAEFHLDRLTKNVRMLEKRGIKAELDRKILRSKI